VLVEKWRLVINGLYGGPNVGEVLCVSIMSRLADYFVVVGHDYDKERM